MSELLKQYNVQLTEAQQEQLNTLAKEIFSHSFKGSYEHQDENANCVECQSLCHGYEGGYSYSFDPDAFFGKLIAKLKS